MEISSRPPVLLSEQVISDLKSRLKSLEARHSPKLTQEHKHEDVCSQKVRSKNDRFLMNLYERPAAFPVDKTRTPVQRSNFEKRKQFDNNKHDKSIYIFGGSIDNPRKPKCTMDYYAELRSRRDVECLRIKESSNILKHLNALSPYGYWFERLLAEKTLLESVHAARVLRKKISENYVSVGSQDVKIGTISVSNFKYYLRDDFKIKPKETEFYVLLLTNDTDIKSSKIARAYNGEIVFDEEFLFPVNRNFTIKLQIYEVSLKENPKFQFFDKSLSFQKPTKYKISKIEFKNLNTCEYEEIQALKSSFTLSGGTEINVHNLHNKLKTVNATPKSSVRDQVSFSIEMKTFKIENKRSGFLNFGSTIKAIIVWNRCWCVLDSCLLKLYKYPSEEDVISPELILDLSICPSSKLEEAPEVLCNRPRSFILEFLKNDLVFNYYFMADTCEDLHNWLAILNTTLDLLKFKTSFKL